MKLESDVSISSLFLATIQMLSVPCLGANMEFGADVSRVSEH
jgi:hypothetical protein